MALNGIIKHQRKILFLMAVVIILMWGFGSSLPRLFRGGTNVYGEVLGKKVSVDDLRDFKYRMERVGTIGRDVTPEEVWPLYVEVEYAKSLGLAVSDEELRDHLKQSLAPWLKTRGIEYTRYIKNMVKLPVGVYQETMKEVLLTTKLRELIIGTLGVTPAQAWIMYKDRTREWHTSYVTVEADGFRDKVEAPSDEDLKRYYEDHKDSAELQVPERVRIEFIALKNADLIDQLEAADEDIAAYYEAHKDDYIIVSDKDSEEPADEESPDDVDAADTPAESDSAQNAAGASEAELTAEETASAAPADAEGVAVGETKSEPAEDEAPATEAGQAQPSEPEELQYKPLEDVREEVQQAVLAEKAKEKARQIMESVYDALFEKLPEEADVRMTHEDVAAALAAGAFQGVPLIEVRTKPFARSEALDIELLGPQVAGDQSFLEDAFALEPGRSISTIYPIDTSSPGDYTFRFVPMEETAAHAPDFDEATKEKIADILGEERALAASRAFAQSLVDAVEAETLSLAEVIKDKEGVELEEADVRYWRMFGRGTVPFAHVLLDKDPGEIDLFEAGQTTYVFVVDSVASANVSDFDADFDQYYNETRQFVQFAPRFRQGYSQLYLYEIMTQARAKQTMAPSEPSSQ